MHVELPAQHMNVTCLEDREQGWEGTRQEVRKNRHVIEVRCGGCERRGIKGRSTRVFVLSSTHTHTHTNTQTFLYQGKARDDYPNPFIREAFSLVLRIIRKVLNGRC